MSESVRLRNADLTWREVDGTIVILDLRASNFLELNRSGTVLWRLLEEAATHDDLAGALMTTFGIDRDQADRDVKAFVAALDEAGLLEP